MCCLRPDLYSKPQISKVLESIVLLSCFVNADFIQFDFPLTVVSARSCSVSEGLYLNKIIWKGFMKASSYVLAMK